MFIKNETLEKLYSPIMKTLVGQFAIAQAASLSTCSYGTLKGKNRKFISTSMRLTLGKLSYFIRKA